MIAMIRYKVAGFYLDFDKYLEKNLAWTKFIHNNLRTKADLEIMYSKTNEVYHGIEKIDLDETNKYIVLYGGNTIALKHDWSKGIFLNFSDQFKAEALIQELFYTHAVQRHMIQFHSSLIDYRGHGLMFLGPSGIGKTTQAELWNKYRDALIINGDIVFVQETKEAFLGWGTPWHGSSPYCENTNVPVDALIILKQAPENSIRKLEGFEKVTAVSNSVFYPRWLENGMELCLETLDHLLSRLPVYELSCRPDEEAVALTEQTIFGGERF